MSAVEPIFGPAFQEMEAEIIQLFGKGGPAQEVQGQPGTFMFDPFPAPTGTHDWVIDLTAGRFKQAWADFTFQSGPKPKPRPTPITQAAINRALAIIASDVHSILQLITAYTVRQLNALSDDTTRSLTLIDNTFGPLINNLQGQINALNHGLSGDLSSAISTAVRVSEAHSDAALNATAQQLSRDISNTIHDLQHETNERVAGDKATLAAAQKYALQTAEFLSKLVDNHVRQVDANEHSDVLNLNNRIGSVQTTLEGQITQGDAATLGAAAGLVAGLGVPALRSQVNTLAQTVAQTAAEADQCLTPLCDTVTPNAKQLGRLGGLLKTLEQLGVAGLLAGLVAAAVEDPQAAANAVEDAGGWMTDVGVSLASAVGG